jgi:predicted RNase H-like nuclease
MPIGLPSGGEPRTCDLEARNALGKSGQTRFFLCPPRQCLDADTPEEFQKRFKKLTGKGAGLPVWGIVRKIKEVDAEMTPELQDRVMEFHPELAWKGLAGTVLDSKHGAEGLLHRINILNKHETAWLPGLKTRHLPSKVKLDDVLDCLVGLSVAHAITEDPSYKNRIPRSDPPKDERRLRMELWF